MRFAKLEIGMICAIFVSMFDFSLHDARGNPLTEPPPVDRNSLFSEGPMAPVRLKLRLKENTAAV